MTEEEFHVRLERNLRVIRRNAIITGTLLVMTLILLIMEYM